MASGASAQAVASFWNALPSAAAWRTFSHPSRPSSNITSSRKPSLTRWSGSYGASHVPQQLLPGSVHVARSPQSRTNPHQCFSLRAKPRAPCMLDSQYMAPKRTAAAGTLFKNTPLHCCMWQPLRQCGGGPCRNTGVIGRGSDRIMLPSRTGSLFPKSRRMPLL